MPVTLHIWLMFEYTQVRDLHRCPRGDLNTETGEIPRIGEIMQ